MRTSEALDKLSEALAEASKKFPPIQRGRTARVPTKNGGSYSYDYADLDDVLSAIRGPLAESGLTLSHDHQIHQSPLAVETIAMLRHASGQFIESSPIILPCDDFMAPIQAVGSAMTYGRRYTAQSLIGVSTESDDDGNGAGGTGAETERKAALPACPQCGKTACVIKGKAEYGAGLLCWKGSKKEPGCGHAWETTEHPFNENHKGKPKADTTNGHADKPKAEAEKTPTVRLNEAMKAIGCATDEDREQVIIWCSGGACEKLDDAFESDERAAQVIEFLNAKRTAGVKTAQMLATAKQYAEDTATL